MKSENLFDLSCGKLGDLPSIIAASSQLRSYLGEEWRRDRRPNQIEHSVVARLDRIESSEIVDDFVAAEAPELNKAQ